METFTTNSYVVNITPSGKTFPVVQIVKRKQTRERGKVSREKELRPLWGDKDAYDEGNIDETARLIGMAILDDSQIIQNWIANRP